MQYDSGYVFSLSVSGITHIEISQLEREREYNDEQQDSAAATTQTEHQDVLMTC